MNASTSTNQSRQSQIEQVLRSQINIPPQPAILLELSRLIDEPDNNLAAISELIERDVGLCAGVFKLVNSSAYSLPHKLTSISKAVSVLGLIQVMNLIKGMALRRVLNGNGRAYQKFWDRSEEIAGLASIIAGRQVAVCNIAMDQAYMAGLFHGCGVPILMQHNPGYCKRFRLNHGGDWPDFNEEDRLFDTDHAVVGYMVAKHWNLPDFICQAIRFQHDQLNSEYAALTLVSIMQMAQHLQTVLYMARDDRWAKIESQVIEEIGLGKDEVKEFMEDVVEVFRNG
jgi:HD-like signal output (HDOD) protein